MLLSNLLYGSGVCCFQENTTMSSLLSHDFFSYLLHIYALIFFYILNKISQHLDECLIFIPLRYDPNKRRLPCARSTSACTTTCHSCVTAPRQQEAGAPGDGKQIYINMPARLVTYTCFPFATER